MHRFLLISSLVFALFGIGAQEVPPSGSPTATAKGGSAITKPNSQKKAENAEQKDYGQSPIPTCDGCFNSYTLEQPHAKTKQDEGKEASLDRLYRRYLWATIIGVIGGFAGLIVLIWQTVIASQTAKATSAQAESIKYSERAWVQAGPDMPEFKLDNLTALDVIAVFNWSITNTGRTPARILEIAARYRLIQSLERIPPVPEYEGDLEKIPLYEMLLIPQGRYWSFQPLEPSNLTPDQITAIRNGQRTLFAYGYVVYLDVFGDRHETRFCWYYCVPQGGMVSFIKEGWRPYLQAPAAYKGTS